MPEEKRGYVVAFVTTAAAAVVGIMLRPYLERSIFILFAAPIALTAWYGGLGPALSAMILGVVAVDVVFLGHDDSFMPNESGDVVARAPKGRLVGSDISFEKVTVTGTENVMMAASLADGKTIIHNAAQEPEIEDLAELLNKMGARINGAGTPTMEIDGVEALGSTHIHPLGHDGPEYV